MLATATAAKPQPAIEDEPEREPKKERFYRLSRRLIESTDPAEQRKLKNELAHLIFGD